MHALYVAFCYKEISFRQTEVLLRRCKRPLRILRAMCREDREETEHHYSVIQMLIIRARHFIFESDEAYHIVIEHDPVWLAVEERLGNAHSEQCILEIRIYL